MIIHFTFLSDRLRDGLLILEWFESLQVAENLAQLMYSVMMTGYMFRNAQNRLELQQSLEQVALPEAQERKVRYFLPFSLFLLFVHLFPIS